MAAYASDMDIKNELTPHWSVICSTMKPIWYKFRGKTQDEQITNESAAAWRVYSNTKASTLDELLLGDLKLRSHVEIMNNFGTTSGSVTTLERGTLHGDGNQVIGPEQITATIRKNMIASGIITETQTDKPPAYIANVTRHFRNGSVLNDGFWWPLINDAWLIGGVHSFKRFHLALASIDEGLLWDSSPKPKGPRLRMLGRELIGLHEAGYRLIGLPAWAIKKEHVDEEGQKTETRTPVASSSVRATIGYVFAPTEKTKALALSFTSYRAAIDNFKSLDDIRSAILDESKALAFDAYDFSKI
ncbi:hypothetical protein JVX91_27155 [Pseudomonas sp. PDNC002]|uniref:hypothetical protein n=1 Tax=Pseudomonas sp. PDNC002 TaxID=2811422 RepID=UPI001964089F|nr:hypothetical protein [Pseudomonas sp. PDNC002]QRY79203.1 hypothetical protein JVX91_27155 [Pseudomonas sp. PDNC002]